MGLGLGLTATCALITSQKRTISIVAPCKEGLSKLPHGLDMHLIAQQSLYVNNGDHKDHCVVHDGADGGVAHLRWDGGISVACG